MDGEGEDADRTRKDGAIVINSDGQNAGSHTQKTEERMQRRRNCWRREEEKKKEEVMVLSGDVLVVATARRAKVLLRVVVARLIYSREKKMYSEEGRRPETKMLNFLYLFFF